MHVSMSGRERDYAGVPHVLDVTDGGGPIQVLAGLFHDRVHVQADGYLSRRHEVLLADVIDKGPNGCLLRLYDPETDRHRAMLEMVFGVEQGSTMSPWDGLNEFLSAMLAVRSLGELLSDDLLVQIAAAI